MSSSQAPAAKAVTLTSGGHKRVEKTDLPYNPDEINWKGRLEPEVEKYLIEQGNLVLQNPQTQHCLKQLYPQRGVSVVHGLGEETICESGTAQQGVHLVAQAKDILFTVFQNLKRLSAKKGRELAKFLKERYLHDIMYEVTGYSKSTFERLSREVR